MEKSRSLTMMGGQGYVVPPAELPEAVRLDLHIVDVEYKEQAPFVYCEYWTLDKLAQTFGLGLLYFGVMAFLLVGGLLWEQKWMIWGGAVLAVLLVFACVCGTWDLFRDIINSRSGGPARRDYS